MARDRQRAKARKAARAAQEQASGTPEADARTLPGNDHVSGEVDEFEARLVGEAGGVPADAAAARELDEQGGAAHPDGLSDAQFDSLEDRIDDVEEAFESGDSGEIERAERAVDRPAVSAGAPTERGRGRTAAFLRASWAELQRVQWPDRQQVGQATAVVLGFVVVAGLFLGLADSVAQKIVDFVI